eukprot:g48738.t1
MFLPPKQYRPPRSATSKRDPNEKLHVTSTQTISATSKRDVEARRKQLSNQEHFPKIKNKTDSCSLEKILMNLSLSTGDLIYTSLLLVSMGAAVGIFWVEAKVSAILLSVQRTMCKNATELNYKAIRFCTPRAIIVLFLMAVHLVFSIFICGNTMSISTWSNHLACFFFVGIECIARLLVLEVLGMILKSILENYRQKAETCSWIFSKNVRICTGVIYLALSMAAGFTKKLWTFEMGSSVLREGGDQAWACDDL